LRKESIDIAKSGITLLRGSVSTFRGSSLKYPIGDSFRCIYSDLADIFESQQLTLELLLLLEGADVPRPYSNKLESMIESVRKESDGVSIHARTR
jgi:hypothetical protein